MAYKEPYAQAVSAYWRAMRRDGFADCQINQPSNTSSEVLSDDEVILWVHGQPVARWRSWTKPRIQWIEAEEPADDDEGELD